MIYYYWLIQVITTGRKKVTKLSINKKSSIPIHIQVRNELLEEFHKGELKPGDRLPSERELQDKYEISRLTVRSAFSDLERDGLIFSRPGKGRYVARSYIDQKLIHLSSFTQDMEKVGAKPSSRVIYQGEEAANSLIASRMQLAPGTPVARITRIRMADNVPMAIEDAWLALSLCPDILEQDFERGSIYVHLNKHGLKPMRAVQTLLADMPTENERQLLEIDPNVAIMRMQRTTSLANTLPIEYVESVYRGDKFKFNAVLTHVEISMITGETREHI